MAEEPVKPEEKEEQKPAESSGTESQPPAAEKDQATAAPSETPAPPETQEAPGKRMALIAIVVLVLALGAVVAGIISGQRARRTTQAEREEVVVPTPTPTEEDALTAQYEQTSDSDEIADIEADLQATSFEGIDAELSDIDRELSAE